MSSELAYGDSGAFPCAPDAIEPIRAWRVWRASHDLVTGQLALHSLEGTLWKPGEPLTARCSRGAHAAPNAQCGCGVYAHKSRQAALEHARGLDRAVVGEVELWGKIVEHEHGYRAQYARPHALWLPLVPDAPSTNLALHHYGLPVGMYDTQTGRVLRADEIHRRALARKIGRCLTAVAHPLVAALPLVLTAVIVLAFAGILAAIGSEIRQGNIGDLLRISVVVGPPVFMVICMCRAD